jgi:hypothetical protein
VQDVKYHIFGMPDGVAGSRSGGDGGMKVVCCAVM